MVEGATRFQDWSPFVGSIYGVSGVGSAEYRYIGLTTGTVDRRRRQHLKSAKAGTKSPFYDWVRRFESPEQVYFEPLELVMSDDLEDLGKAERRWIARLRDDGHRLLNLTEGGLGPRGYVWTAEQRQAAGDRARGRKRTNVPRGPDHPSWGRTHSDELKQQWSERRKGMNSGAANPNFGKVGPAHPSFGRVVTELTRAVLSEQKRGEKNPNFGKSASAETRAKMSAVRRGRPMPSSVRSAHTRHHTNAGMFKDTCKHCVDDANPTKASESRKDA